MPKQAEVTYLFNSGFIVELKNKILVFDYFQDEKNQVPAVLEKGKKVYFFNSHSHYDHFDQKVILFKDKAEHYFFSFDIEHSLGEKDIAKDKLTFLQAYDAYENETIKIETFSSTDEGISFLVEADGWRIFHAGDFNWWHWQGDLAENIKLAKNGFMKQMKKLDGLQMDIAFFPVDLRLGEYCDLGAREFCRRTQIQNLVTMHNTQNKPWQVPKDFYSQNKGISFWIPEQPGESIKFIR